MENNAAAVSTPSVKRRLVSLIYDFLLLCAVEFVAVALYTLVTFNLHSNLLDRARTLVIVLAAGAYYIYQWTDSGFTLAMKTWRIKLVMAGQPKVPVPVAIKRYVFAWGFVAPALIVIEVMHLASTRAGTVTSAWLVLANVVAWSLTAFLDKDRQFLHDHLAGTRLIQLPAKAKAKPSTPAPPADAGSGDGA
ncbi:MAG: RDD family protein [Telluria sp.]